MTDIPHLSKEPGVDTRRLSLLDAALQVFVRLGYRKTSMDDVARAANVSRQGLYLHFANKEHLFRATVEQSLEKALANVQMALATANRPLDERLIAAFDAWVGYTIELRGGDIEDLLKTSQVLLGPAIDDGIHAFRISIEDAIANTPALTAAYAPIGIGVRDLTDTLHTVAVRLKSDCASRPEFLARMSIAVRIICHPLSNTVADVS